MSRLEQKNLFIFVAAIVGLVVGVGVLANYTGILQAEPKQQTQPKVSCSVGGTCGSAEATTAGLTSGAAGGSSCAEKEAACSDECGDCCQEKSCPEKASGCCDTAKTEGCCETETDGTI